MHRSDIHLIEMSHPGDTSGLAALLERGEIAVADIRGIQLMHEGDLVANAWSAYAYADLLSDHTGRPTAELLDEFPIQALAGAVGFMPPHAAIFVRREVDGAAGPSAQGEKRMAVAGVCTRRFRPEEIGTDAYLREIERCTRQLLDELEVGPDDVHLVFAKAPWPGTRHTREAHARGAKLRSDDFWRMGEYARGGAALGIALALGEINDDVPAADQLLLVDRRAYSTRAQCSSTEERETVALIMVANSPASVSPYVAAHGVLEDGLDTGGVKDVLRGTGMRFDCCPSSDDLARVHYAFLKPKTSEAETLWGRRHTLIDHPTVGSMWWMIEKAPVHAAVASVLGTTMIEVATGPEHQGPIGRPLLAVVARVEDGR